MISHVITINQDNYSPNYIQFVELPIVATRVVGISVYAYQKHDASLAYEAELVLNDDRNHIVLPIQVTGPRFGSHTDIEDRVDFENFSGIVPCSVSLIRNTIHQVILRGIEKATITLRLETCQDDPE